MEKSEDPEWKLHAEMERLKSFTEKHHAEVEHLRAALQNHQDNERSLYEQIVNLTAEVA